MFVTLLFTAFFSNAQTTKGNWLMGGSAGISNSRTSDGTSTTEATSVAIWPNIGYFFFDNFSLGLTGRFNYVFPKGESSTVLSNTISPFIRYYFLEPDKKINIFSEVGYEVMRLDNSSFKADSFLIKAGTVFFVHNSVGIEVALNYSNQKTNQNIKTQNISLGFGFQIHLERE